MNIVPSYLTPSPDVGLKGSIFTSKLFRREYSIKFDLDSILTLEEPFPGESVSFRREPLSHNARIRVDGAFIKTVGAGEVSETATSRTASRVRP